MKVLHLYRTCYPETKGGLEQAIRYICKGTAELGVENTILTLGDSNKDYLYENYRIIVIKKDLEISSNGFSLRLISTFIKLSRTHDIIHYQYPWPTGDLLSLFAPKKPSLVSYQSDIVKQKILKKLYWPLEQRFLSKVDRIMASSPQYAKTSHNLIKFKDKVEIIPLAIDESSYPAVSNDNLEKWQHKVGEGFFLFIGVLRYYKGLHYLLEAANINKLPVVIAGDGPERKALQDYIDRHNLTNIKMVGFISEEDKASLHTLSKAFVFPSHLRSEAFGISLVEAQMYGKPVVSCDIGTGSSYVNINNQTGYTVEPENAMAFSNAMIKINDNITICTELGQNSRKRFENNFTSKRYAKNYIDSYNSLLNK
ncbi:glycosyltransferase [Vibrio sp. MA40-2]|uniref:glycosyltransferase n=1 Tax=Vibrio sp. MA40-2 TaxID=3391828 RepID=UPI0039A724DC